MENPCISTQASLLWVEAIRKLGQEYKPETSRLSLSLFASSACMRSIFAPKKKPAHSVQESAWMAY